MGEKIKTMQQCKALILGYIKSIFFFFFFKALYNEEIYGKYFQALFQIQWETEAS